MQTITDNMLIEQLRKEDNVSFQLLYQFYFPSIAAYIQQNQGNSEDAEDIFQEAIIVLLQKIRQTEFVLSSSLKTYLYAIAKNLWLKRLRDNKIKISDLEFSPDIHGTESVTMDIEMEECNEVKVEHWLQKITRNCQNILKALFFYEEPMDAFMLKMGWKNKYSANNQKYKCIQQIKKVKDKDL
jgi:RNA polymerase sigma factor (sigma-70 family)